MRGVVMAATVLILGMAVGCGSVPEWVQKGSAAYDGQEGNAFYGVGLAAPSPNQQVQHDVAKMNGRVEIARTQQAYVAELLKPASALTPYVYRMPGLTPASGYSYALSPLTGSTATSTYGVTGLLRNTL